MAIPDEEKEGQKYEDEQQYAALHRLIDKSGMSEEFVIWYLNNFHGADAVRFETEYPGDRSVNLLKSQFTNPTITERYARWQKELAIPKAGGPGLVEGLMQGAIKPTEPWQWVYAQLGQQQREAAEAGEVPKAADAASPGGALTQAVGNVFSGLSAEELSGLGAEGISEKFGLQRLAIEEPEAFLQAMFDKAGISPSPPVYGFLRDMMPSLVLLASTREGQDIINSPGGATQLNKAINEVISQGYPTRGSILEGLAKMGGLGRAFLGEGASAEPRTEFRFIAATLNDLIGPTMSQPIRRALFNERAIETQGDRFLSAAGRGVFQGSFIDWLKQQGYPIPDLPAYTPTAGGGDIGGGGNFVTSEVGGVGTTPTGAPAFQVKGGVYEE